MRILIDMNLSPQWIEFLTRHSHTPAHWKNIGPENAPDSELMSWAKANDHIVFTQDLDFTHLIALAEASGPSIFQIRTMNNMPDSIGDMVISALKQFEQMLKDGAIVVVDQRRARARILPLR